MVFQWRKNFAFTPLLQTCKVVLFLMCSHFFFFFRWTHTLTFSSMYILCSIYYIRLSVCIYVYVCVYVCLLVCVRGYAKTSIFFSLHFVLFHSYIIDMSYFLCYEKCCWLMQMAGSVSGGSDFRLGSKWDKSGTFSGRLQDILSRNLGWKSPGFVSQNLLKSDTDKKNVHDLSHFGQILLPLGPNESSLCGSGGLYSTGTVSVCCTAWCPGRHPTWLADYLCYTLTPPALVPCCSLIPPTFYLH